MMMMMMKMKMGMSYPSTSTTTRTRCCSSIASSSSSLNCCSTSSASSLRCAVLGAGFAGLSLAFHLLQQSPHELKLQVDIFDEYGIGGGASGVSGGLIHPYSPKLKPLWRAEDCWTDCLNLLHFAQLASNSTHSFIPRTTGILRPAVSHKYLDVMLQNASNFLPSCPVEVLDAAAARQLVPNLCSPLDVAFFMPQAVNINPQSYLQALFLACENLVESSGSHAKSISLHKTLVPSLRELEGTYDAVIVCLGARVDMLPELSGLLPVRTCRGIVANLQLHDVSCSEYPDSSPSILSDAWVAVQGPQSLYLGSTWEWNSRNYSALVSSEEATATLRELIPKASTFYPQITKWALAGARAGLRAMPPLTPDGSLPLLGCIDDLVGGSAPSKFWLVGGLGSRGLLYHGWLGKLTAKAVLSSSEDILPPELISWREMRRKRP